MIKIVVFDLDGTLVNSLTDLALSVNGAMKNFGLEEKPIENYKNYVGNGRKMLITRAMGDAASDTELFEKVERLYNELYAVHYNDNTTVYDGCAELLERLDADGIKTAVLSNKPDEFVGCVLKSAYPNHTFTEAWGQKPQYSCKPNPESLFALLAAHKISPDECMYVGDSNVDVITAKNANTKFAGVAWGFRGKEELFAEGAAFVADTAEELYEYIRSLNE